MEEDNKARRSSASLNVTDSAAESGQPVVAVIKRSNAADDTILIPLLSDQSSITLATLQSHFPDAIGLKYKVREHWYAVTLDETGLNFLPPIGGWIGKMFEVTTGSVPRPKSPDFPGTAVDISKLSIADNLGERVFQKCRKYLFYSKLIGFQDFDEGESAPLYDPGDNKKFIITVISRYYAVTTGHCLKKMVDSPDIRNGKENDQFKIFSCEDPQTSMVVTVKQFLHVLDCAILYSSTGFAHYPCTNAPRIGMRAVCLGFPSFERIDGGTVTENQICETEPVPFVVEVAAINVPEIKLFAASCGLAQGFSGGGLFRIYGKSEILLGICVRGRIPPESWAQKWAEEGWLHRRSVSYYISAEVIASHVRELEVSSTKRRKT
uniref:TAR DNA-binding protein 43 N-terminal domain-containing protein n=1 Tax=Panagrolaimus sp. JU765 TaxID=591449 RepID=A0AC34Q7I5_9BILA